MQTALGGGSELLIFAYERFTARSRGSGQHGTTAYQPSVVSSHSCCPADTSVNNAEVSTGIHHRRTGLTQLPKHRYHICLSRSSCVGSGEASSRRDIPHQLSGAA